MFGITSGKRALFFFEKNNVLLNDFPHFAGNPIELGTSVFSIQKLMIQDLVPGMAVLSIPDILFSIWFWVW